jgi:phenol hydroxylase P2 protein
MSTKVERSVVGIELMAGEECDAIVESVLERIPDAQVVPMPGMIQLDVPDRLVIHAAAVSEILGRDWDSRDLNQVVSAYRGYFTRWDREQVVLSWDADDQGDETDVR